MPFTLFLDANIYLSFHHLSSDDLNELEKVVALIKGDQIELLLPLHTRREYYRNRENKLKDALNRFDENKLNNVFPLFCRDYEVEYSALQKSIKEYEENKKKIRNLVYEDIMKYNLKADKVINELFNNAKVIDYSSSLINSAKTRFDLGHPPGKNNSYGDALIWECLIESVDNKTNLVLISDDKDFSSVLDKQKLNPFLHSEWRQRKKSFIVFYSKLSSFMKDEFPHIKFASEARKDFLIEDLHNSNSFRQTRSILSELTKITDFSTIQIEAIITAATTNNQIYWLAEDSDINSTLHKLIEGRTGNIEESLLYTFDSHFNLSKLDSEALPEISSDDDGPAF